MNEVKLIIKCQKGEKEAFNELITIYYPYNSEFANQEELTLNEAPNMRVHIVVQN